MGVKNVKLCKSISKTINHMCEKSNIMYKLFGKLGRKLGNFTHGTLGFITAILIVKGFTLIAIMLIIAFTLYQLIDYLRGEDLKETLKDIQEFIVGFTCGIVWYAIHVLKIPIPFI